MLESISPRKIFRKFFKKMVLGNQETRCSESPISNIENTDFELKNHRIATRDNIEIGISIIQRKKMDKKTIFFIICHGTGCNRGGYAWLFKKNGILDRNICALLLDYREFGDSDGDFNMKDVNYDIDACLQYLKQTYMPEKIHLYGHSLGSAIIFEYARYVKTLNIEKLYDKVVSVSGFKTLEDVCKRFTLWKITSFIPGLKSFVSIEFSYRSIENIQYIDKNNLLLLHGRLDDLIPITHGLCLSKVSNATLLLTKDDHISIVGSKVAWGEIFKFFGSEY